MYPYINNLDISKPMGRLVFNYGFEEYCRGLITGFIIGTSFCGFLYLLSKFN